MWYHREIPQNNVKSDPLSLKTKFYSNQYKNGCLAASDLFHVFTQSIKFYTFYYHVLESTDI